METTQFLAQVWGPVIFAVGAGIMMNRAFYRKIYHDLEQDALAVLIFGMVAMSTGIAQIAFHNSWGSLPEILVTLLGWGLLAKGAAFIVMPDFVDRAGDFWAGKNLLPVAGTLTLLVGAYLSWFAYLA